MRRAKSTRPRCSGWRFPCPRRSHAGWREGDAVTDAGAPLATALEAGVLTLTLDRPAKRNALSAVLVDALHAAIDRADLDAEVRVLVLRGAGSDFCAGADLEELLASADRTLGENEAAARRL